MQVISGEVKADLVGEKVLQISSEADRTILQWDKFSIDNAETTRFVLPSNSSSILNRITGKEFTAIDGLLESNGRVFLINPNGIIIGKDGMVKTAGFYASTLDIKNSEFMLDKMKKRFSIMAYLFPKKMTNFSHNTASYIFYTVVVEILLFLFLK